jgi:SOS-response transcriptional repressor LexA
MSPRFNVGDIVVLDPDVDIQPNDLVLAVVDQRMLTFRQFHSRGQDPATGQRRFDLVPLSPAFETWHSTEHEIELLGAMVEFTSFAR